MLDQLDEMHSFPLPEKIQEVLQPNQTAIDDDKTTIHSAGVAADSTAEGRTAMTLSCVSRTAALT